MRHDVTALEDACLSLLKVLQVSGFQVMVPTSNQRVQISSRPHLW